MTTHTPAPWRIVADGINHWVEIEPNKIALIKANEADMNLIVAAPLMVETLNMIIHECDNQNGEGYSVIRNLAQSILNKAEGK